jgi:alpha-amylase/alpha-mannosidase (GH57 family)
MPLFLCDKCGVIENTALSNYWVKDQTDGDKALCSECSGDGWHGTFPRQFMTDEQIAEAANWSGWVYCERLKGVLDAYARRIADERTLQELAKAKAREPMYPLHIAKMPCRGRSERKAKQRAKREYLAGLSDAHN